MTNYLYRNALLSAIVDCQPDCQFLRSAAQMGNQGIERAATDLMWLNHNTRSAPPTKSATLLI